MMKLATTTLHAATLLLLAGSTTAYAQSFTFRWDGEAAPDTKWENATNWYDETTNVNLNFIVPNRILATETEPAKNFNVHVRNDGTVDFDANTSLALTGDASGTVLINRLLLGSPGSGSGDGTVNVSGGSLNATLSGASTVSVFGRGQDGTLNISGGDVSFGHRMLVGSGLDGHGLINLSGGSLAINRGGNSTIMTGDDISTYGRPSLDLGDDDGGTDPLVNSTTGIFRISGGTFRTRTHVALGRYAIFDVQGSSASDISIGSQGSGDGAWLQYEGATLRAGVDTGGITPIFIDDVDDDGQGDVKFYPGTFLDPYDAGGALENIWHTVMEWDGTLVENGLALTQTAINDGWEMQVNGSELQVRLPGAGGVPGDFNQDGNVDAADYAVWRDNQNSLSALPNDGGLGTPIGAGHYSLWTSTYGASSSPSAALAVPEPTALTALCIATLGLVTTRRCLS